MGFEIYMKCFAGGRPSAIRRGAVRALFPIVEYDSAPNHWSLRYGPTDSCEIGVTASDSDKELVTALCIHRPCGDARFWEAVLSILRMGSVILYFPGMETPLVASEWVASDLPNGMVESVGQPRCVGSAQEILDAIHKG